MSAENYRALKQNRAIQDFISNIPLIKSTNYLITVTFARGSYGPMRRRHVEDARKMVQAYARLLSIACHGRERRFSQPRIPFIGWPEDKTKTGGLCPLHFHMLCYFPRSRHEELENITVAYWNRVCAVSKHEIIPSIDIRDAYNSSGVANYNGKNTTDDLTIEYMVMSGFA